VDPVPTMLKILIQSESREIFGVHVIGRQAAEIVNLASVAIRCHLTLEQLLSNPLVHPSAAEAIQECVKVSVASRLDRGVWERRNGWSAFHNPFWTKPLRGIC